MKTSKQSRTKLPETLVFKYNGESAVGLYARFGQTNWSYGLTWDASEIVSARRAANKIADAIGAKLIDDTKPYLTPEVNHHEESIMIEGVRYFVCDNSPRHSNAQAIIDSWDARGIHRSILLHRDPWGRQGTWSAYLMKDGAIANVEKISEGGY